MSRESTRQQTYLAPGDLTTLIRMHSLPVTDCSPLRPYVETESAQSQSNLKARGLHRAAWREALTVLAAPTRQVRVQVPGPFESFTAIYYSQMGDTNWVGCWLEEDGRHVSFPWDSDQILALAWQTLLTTPVPASDAPSLTLSLPGLTALAAAVDSLRAQLLRSLLYRDVKPDLQISRGALAEQLELGLGHTDCRWLVTLIDLAGSRQFPLSPQSLPPGVEELTAAGLLLAEADGWRPAPFLQRLALHWRSPLPALALESLVVETTGDLCRYGHRLILRGDGPLWHIDYGAHLWQSNPQVTLAGIDPKTCFDGLAELVAAPLPVPTPHPTEPPATDVGAESAAGLAICPYCQGGVSANARFCRHCGSPLREMRP